jgi:hypothetical protein
VWRLISNLYARETFVRIENFRSFFVGDIISIEWGVTGIASESYLSQGLQNLAKSGKLVIRQGIHGVNYDGTNSQPRVPQGVI